MKLLISKNGLFGINTRRIFAVYLDQTHSKEEKNDVYHIYVDIDKEVSSQSTISIAEYDTIEKAGNVLADVYSFLADDKESIYRCPATVEKSQIAVATFTKA